MAAEIAELGQISLMLAPTQKRPQNTKKRTLFTGLMSGVAAMRDHREGRITPRDVLPIAVPPIAHASFVRHATR